MPGYSVGSSINRIWQSTIVDSEGSVWFTPSFTSPESADSGSALVKWEEGQLRTIAGAGTPVLGVPGARLMSASVFDVRIDENGNAILSAYEQRDGHPLASSGVYAVAPTGIVPIVRNETFDPEYPGANRVTGFVHLGHAASNKIVFGAVIDRPRQSWLFGLWSNMNGTFERVLTQGQPAAPEGGTEFDVNSIVIEPFIVNDGTIFFGTRKSSFTNSFWSLKGDSLDLVAAESSPVLGEHGGLQHSSLPSRSYAMNSAGSLAFLSRFQGGDVEPAKLNDTGIVVYKDGVSNVIVRTGFENNVVSNSIVNRLDGAMDLNEAGDLLFSGRYYDITEAKSYFGLWLNQQGQTRTIVRSGDIVQTETGPASIIWLGGDRPGSVLLLESDLIVFQAKIKTALDEYYTLIARLPGGDLVPMFGSDFEIAPGDTRRILQLDYQNDTTGKSFNQRGDLAIVARFYDGTSALLYTSSIAIPEAPTYSLLAIPSVILLLRKHRRPQSRS